MEWGFEPPLLVSYFNLSGTVSLEIARKCPYNWPRVSLSGSEHSWANYPPGCAGGLGTSPHSHLPDSHPGAEALRTLLFLSRLHHLQRLLQDSKAGEVAGSQADPGGLGLPFLQGCCKKQRQFVWKWQMCCDQWTRVS